MFVTSESLVEFAARRSELEDVASAHLVDATARAACIEAIGPITSTVIAGEEGKLFGSIGTKDIADAIIGAGIQVEKSEVKLPDGSIREIGEFDISIQVHADVTQVVKLVVAAEE